MLTGLLTTILTDHQRLLLTPSSESLTQHDLEATLSCIIRPLHASDTGCTGFLDHTSVVEASRLYMSLYSLASLEDFD